MRCPFQVTKKNVELQMHPVLRDWGQARRHSCSPSFLFFQMVLDIEHRGMFGKRSTTELYPDSIFFYFETRSL